MSTIERQGRLSKSVPLTTRIDEDDCGDCTVRNTSRLVSGRQTEKAERQTLAQMTIRMYYGCISIYPHPHGSSVGYNEEIYLAIRDRKSIGELVSYAAYDSELTPSTMASTCETKSFDAVKATYMIRY